MIAECAAARERGDWRAACEAALFDVAVDDPAPVADLLAGFAPDLLRWHLPRTLGGSVHVRGWRTYLLAGDGPIGPDTMVLLVRTPDVQCGANRMSLEAVRADDLGGRPVHPLPPWLWDARRAADLPTVMPTEPTTDRAALAERWTAAGWELDDGGFGSWQSWHVALLRGIDPVLAARELRRIPAQFGHRSWEVQGRWDASQVRLESSGDRLRVTTSTKAAAGTDAVKLRLLAEALQPPIDLALIRSGQVDPADLHPLVRAALAPAATGELDTSVLPAVFTEERVFRVRCRGVWHWVAVRAGRLELSEHSEAERQRELSLRAFGGEISGCFAADLAWRGQAKWLPRALRDYRKDLWLRLEFGGSRVVVAALDAGLEPRLRDGGGRTLVHLLGAFGDPAVLARLLAAGLDVNARDRQGVTPLYEAVLWRWPLHLIVALVEAGARPRMEAQGVSPIRFLERLRPRDLTPDRAAVLNYLKEKA